jgi:uncharacterized heparinase superfamily protein
MEGPFSFRFLNRGGSVETAGDWNAATCDKLWLYNLHYFDDLNADESSVRGAWHRHLIARWIRENPPGHGNGWEPYPSSLRVVNWIKWALAGNPLDQEALQSLAIQTRYLRRRLEWHLLGNHLFANAKALLFAGLYFDGDEAEHWRCIGLQILARETPEQILPDGGHFELSPMYHSIIQEDLLDLVNLARTYPDRVPEHVVASWIAALRRMRSWLVAMLHQDGGISFFNDAAHGIAVSPAELEAYAQRLRLGGCPGPSDGVTHLEPSGYIRVQQGDYVALLDVGGVGPDYLPGHAHADTLSFEISASGQRLVVNSGTSLYEAGLERFRQRSTAAHNTVVVDGESSSEVWNSFRVARRAHPINLSISRTGDDTHVQCAHDGYWRLPGKVTHGRDWHFRADGFTLEDRLDGNFSSAVSYLHFHPDVRLFPAEDRMECPSGRQIGYRVLHGNQSLVEDIYHPEFGCSVRSRCLNISMPTGLGAIRLSFAKNP